MTTQTSAPPLPSARTTAAPLTTRSLAAVLVALLVPVMSFFSVNVALRAIGTDLDASPSMLQLVVGAYGVVYAALVVVGGRLGDTHGRRRLMLVGFAWFLVTSVLCALATSPEMLVGARFLQGVSAALVAPQVLGTIHAGTTGAAHGRAMAWFGATAGIATSLAFLIGGGLASSRLGWQGVFWVNVPLTAIVMIAIARWVPESKAPTRSSIDGVGALLLGLTMTALILPLTEGRAVGWPLWTWVSLALVPVGAGLLGAWQHRLTRHDRLPLIPPAIFAFRGIRVGLLVATPMFISFGGFMFVYAAMAGTHGFGPLTIGVSMLPMSAAFLAASVVSGRLVPRFGSRVLTVGALLASAGLGLLALQLRGLSDGSALALADVMTPMPLIGFGFGLIWAPLTGIVLAQVPPASAGLGGGLFITVMQAGLGFGSAVVGSVYLGWGGSTGFTPTAALLAVVMLVVAGLTPQLGRPRRGGQVG